MLATLLEARVVIGKCENLGISIISCGIHRQVQIYMNPEKSPHGNTLSGSAAASVLLEHTPFPKDVLVKQVVWMPRFRG